jgi:apolipoprotein N-acyltransferase
LLSFAWLGLPGWTLFFAFLPLLYLDQFFVEHKSEFSSISFWGHAFMAFFIWNSITTWWIFFATPLGMALAIVTNSLLMSVVWWVAHTARRSFKGNLGYMALVVFWITFEYFHFHWDIEWPWLNLGNGFANNVKLVQWYEFTGALGGSLWVLVLNILLYTAVALYFKRQSVRKMILLVAAILLIVIVPMAISLAMYFNYTEVENPKQVIVVQPNIDPYSEKYDAEAEQMKLEKFVSLASYKLTDETDFIIGPETLFENPRYWNENELNNNLLLRQLGVFISSAPNAELVFGVSSFKSYPDQKSAPPTARKNNNMVYDMFNTAIFLGSDVQPQVYHKSILVVGVEKMPFGKLFGFLGDMVINIGGTSNTLGVQDEPTNFVAADSTLVAPVICYESVFGEYVTKYVQKGANLIFIITNDGWWRNTPGYRQHLSFASLRAIETRRSIARSANTGISCFINQRGDILQATEWWVPTAISGTINANSKITFYVKYGDYIARIALFMSIALLANLLVVRVVKRK